MVTQCNLTPSKALFLRPRPCLGARADLSSPAKLEQTMQVWDALVGKLQAMLDRDDKGPTQRKPVCQRCSCSCMALTL